MTAQSVIITLDIIFQFFFFFFISVEQMQFSTNTHYSKLILTAANIDNIIRQAMYLSHSENLKLR